MPGGGSSTRKVRTPVLPGFGKGRLFCLAGKWGALIQGPKGRSDARAPRRCSSTSSVLGCPFGLGQSPSPPPSPGTRAEQENIGCRCL